MGQPAYANIYKLIAEPLIKERVMQQLNPFIWVREHSISEN